MSKSFLTPVAAVAITGPAVAIAQAATSGTKHAHAASTHSRRGPRGPRGYRGAQGAQGPQGAQGAQGANGLVPGLVTVDSPKITLAPGQTRYDVMPTGFTANCPSGYSVVGTGFNADVGKADFVLSYGTFVGGFFENPSSINVTVYAQGICGQVSGGSAGANARSSGPLAAYRADLVQAQAG